MRGTTPQADEGVGCRPAVQQVVVADQPDLAVGVDGDAVAGIHPHDVVHQHHTVGAGGQADALANQLQDGVVEQAVAAGHGVAALHPHTLVGVGIDDVVDDAAVAGVDHAHRVAVDAVALEQDVVDVEAGGVGIHRIADEAGGVLAVDAGTVVVHQVALEHRAGGVEVDAPAGLVVDLVGTDDAAAAIGGIQAQVAVVMDPVVVHEGADRGIQVDTLPVVADVVARHLVAAGVLDVDAALAVVAQHVVEHTVGVVAGADPDAVLHVGVDLVGTQGVAVAVDVAAEHHPVVGAGDVQVRQGHIVSARKLHRPCVGVGIAPVQRGDAAQVGRAGDLHTRILGQQHGIGVEPVVAGVDVDHVASAQVVGAQQGRQAGHRPRRVLAAEQVVARRGGVLVASQRGVVHVVGVAAVGDEERLVGHVGRHLGATGIAGDDPHARRVAIGGLVRRPVEAAIAEAVGREAGAHRLPTGTVVQADLHVDRGAGGHTGHHTQDLEAADLGAPAVVRIGQQVEADAAATGGQHVEFLHHGRARGAGLGADVELALHGVAIEHDVELAQAGGGVDVVFGEVQAHQILAIGHRHVPADALPPGAAAVADALVHTLRRRVGDTADIHRLGVAGLALRLGLEGVALPIAQLATVHRPGGTCIEQQHRLGGHHAGGVPGDGRGLAHLQLGVAVGAADLDQLRGAGRGLRGVAEGAHVDAVAIGLRLEDRQEARVAGIHAG